MLKNERAGAEGGGTRPGASSRLQGDDSRVLQMHRTGQGPLPDWRCQKESATMRAARNVPQAWSQSAAHGKYPKPTQQGKRKAESLSAPRRYKFSSASTGLTSGILADEGSDPMFGGRHNLSTRTKPFNQPAIIDSRFAKIARRHSCGCKERVDVMQQLFGKLVHRARISTL
ncbi:hypothetical protein [Martelella soudanensis]|uniref:hypothetical protein n=1 Tax=unclassified Martelella TaxID=2629616 RepID=UPI0015DE0399|nr:MULTISPECIES: hypothetical protein [unclassified Martelella]